MTRDEKIQDALQKASKIIMHEGALGLFCPVSRLEGELAAHGLRIEPDWNFDMDAAPRDGSWVLLFGGYDGSFDVAFWPYDGAENWEGIEDGKIPGGWPKAWRPITPPQGEGG